MAWWWLICAVHCIRCNHVDDVIWIYFRFVVAHFRSLLRPVVLGTQKREKPIWICSMFIVLFKKPWWWYLFRIIRGNIEKHIFKYPWLSHIWTNYWFLIIQIIISFFFIPPSIHLNMLIQDTFTSIIRCVFNILSLKYMHVIQKWILNKGQKSRTLRHCSKYAHTWDIFKSLRKFPRFYEKLQKRFSLFAFNLWKKMSSHIPINMIITIFALESAIFGDLDIKIWK